MISPDDLKYTSKECYLVGDINRMQNTIEYWWQHVNAKTYECVRHHFHGRICDVGCNDGMMTLYAAQFEDVSHVVGVDIFPLAIKNAMQYANFANLAYKVSFQTFNFVWDNIPLQNESFDGIISFHTLEHIFPEDVGTFIRHMYELLVMGGKVFVSIPNDHWIGSSEHKTFYTMQTLCDVFRKGGFSPLCAWVCNGSGGDTGEMAILNGLFGKLERGEGDIS